MSPDGGGHRVGLIPLVQGHDPRQDVLEWSDGGLVPAPVHIHNGDVGLVDQRIEGQLRLNRLADVLGLAHVNDPFHDR